MKKGDLVAVLSKLDPVSGEQGQWWRCRTRDGKIGFLPGVYMGEIVPAAAKKVGAAQKAIEEGRAKTMSDSSSRANSLVEGKAQAQGEKGRWGVEEFQKGGEDS